MNEIKKDIIDKINADFPPDDAELIVEIIKGVREKQKQLYSDRIIRCMLQISNGDIAEFDNALHLAEKDFRDLIVASEYKSFEKRIRNFNNPFGQEALN